MAIDLHSRLFKDFTRGRFVVIYSENAVVVLVGFTSRFIVIISSVRDFIDFNDFQLLAPDLTDSALLALIFLRCHQSSLEKLLDQGVRYRVRVY